MIWQVLLVIGSLVVLILGARLLVVGASAQAARAGLPPMLIGLTVVGIGTSTPELATSLLAASRGFDSLAVGNLVGSNIFNLAVILGTTALLRPIAVAGHFVRGETLIVIAAAMIPFSAILTGGTLGRIAGSAMLLGFGLYLRRAIVGSRREAALTPPIKATPVPPGGQLQNLGRIVSGMVLLVAGSHFLVQSATALAAGLGLSELVIGLTVVAAGTSAPELVTSLVAARRGEVDLAVGNIYGSNVFNLLGILGATCLVQPQVVPGQVLWFDAPVMLILSLAMLPILLSGGRLSRAEGVFLLAAYGAYTAFLLT